MDQFEQVDAILEVVETARKMNRRSKTRQVWSGEERDHMRTVASVWFSKYRPEVASRASEESIARVDAAIKRVWDATAKSAARTTYRQSLDEARKGLLQVRKELPIVDPTPELLASDDAPPDFSPLATQPDMQAIMSRRWAECTLCLSGGANLAAVVMMGGLVESLFVSKANHLSDKSVLATASRAPKKSGRSVPFQKWTLNDYIEVGHELGWIGNIAKSVSGSLRDYRNFVHPQAELTRGHRIDEQDARLLWEVTKAVIRELLSR